MNSTDEMADDNSDGDLEDGLEELTPNVSEDRPLDALVPGMGPGAGTSNDEPHADAPSDVDAIHPRVLEVGLEEGREWTFALWDDPGASEIRGDLLQLVRATLLRELSRPPGETTDEEPFVGMRVLSFDSLLEESRNALRALGFTEEPYDPEEYSERMKAWRNEATAGGFRAPARPTSNWFLPVARHEGDRGEALDAIVGSVIDELGGEVWGETPGGPSKLFARELEQSHDVEIGMDLESIATMESHAFPEATSAIRWCPPVIFQAICDYAGVVLHGAYGVRVQWGLCEPDERGVTPPPMFRTPGDDRRIPVGRALLDWCVLPPNDSETDNGVLAERLDELGESLSGAG